MLFTGDWHSDNAIMFSVLDSIPLYTGNDRCGSKIYKKNLTKTSKPESCKFGTTWRLMIGKEKREYCPILKGYKTKLYQDYPELFDVFNEFRDYYFKEFIFDSVTINKMPKGVSMKPHYDKMNVGESVLVAFGDYKGGNTFIKKDERNYKIVDARDEPQQFNGHTTHHFVSTIKEGLRYSLVFYNSKNKF